MPSSCIWQLCPPPLFHTYFIYNLMPYLLLLLSLLLSYDVSFKTFGTYYFFFLRTWTVFANIPSYFYFCPWDTFCNFTSHCFYYYHHFIYLVHCQILNSPVLYSMVPENSFSNSHPWAYKLICIAIYLLFLKEVSISILFWVMLKINYLVYFCIYRNLNLYALNVDFYCRSEI